jgi:hypothetical protein
MMIDMMEKMYKSSQTYVVLKNVRRHLTEWHLDSASSVLKSHLEGDLGLRTRLGDRSHDGGLSW